MSEQGRILITPPYSAAFHKPVSTFPLSYPNADPRHLGYNPRQYSESAQHSGHSKELSRPSGHHTHHSDQMQHTHHMPHRPSTHRKRSSIRMFWDRLSGRDRPHVTWGRSVWNVSYSSWVNLLIVFIPLSWISHFLKWDDRVTFGFSVVALMPLEHLFEYGGKQMSLYLGPMLGDLVIITLKNAVEAALALVLLIRCQLKLLQSTIAGVIILNLLLVPGASFLAQGTNLIEQELHTHMAQLNHTLLTIGITALLFPAAFFAAIGGDSATISANVAHDFLEFSRGMSIVLLIVYAGSRLYLHHPPGVHADVENPLVSEHFHEHEKKMREQDPELNPWFCLLMLVCLVTVMIFTAEWLVYSLKHAISKSLIEGRDEWFGLILLPLVSWSGDAIVSLVYFFRHAFGSKVKAPETVAESRPIDMSIQFILFWFPLLVLVSWFSGRPLSMLFDLFEIVALIAACFLVNYVTADSKTNWAEGVAMMALYFMIALVAWYYPGQAGPRNLLASCVRGGGLVPSTSG